MGDYTIGRWDDLSIEVKALICDAARDPSFDGWAIVLEDYVFMDVNSQFCAICGVTPAELLGKKFTDITPERLGKLDARNADLVKEGWIPHYTIEKTYRFPVGEEEFRKVDVELLVVGIYHPETGKFLCYLSRIMGMERKDDTVILHQESQLHSFVKENKKTIIGIIGSSILFALLKVFEVLGKGGSQ